MPRALRKSGAVFAVLTAAGLLTATPAHALTGGTPAAQGDYAFTAQISGAHGCTGALVAPQWVLTAAACFGPAPLPAGPPATPYSATVGRADLTGTAGHTVKITTLVPAADRDVVLAKLALPIVDVAPVPLATRAPVAGDVLRLGGYGRTADTWVPDRLSTATFTVNGVNGTALDVTATSGDATTCLGDAGGPALRENGPQVELAALNTRSWQHGCFTSTETRQGTTETRVDDLGAWVAQVTAPVAAGIVGKASGQCLDQDWSNGQAHPTLNAWQCWTPSETNQQWKVTWVSGDTVSIVNARSGECLDQDYTGQQPHPTVNVWQCWTPLGANQTWTVRPHYEDGTVSLVNKRSGQCLDQDYTGQQPHPAVNAWQCWDPATANQRWILN
ncbi:trypsin-like serine protease [Amycolatopsis sp. NPDC048633]|uniref:RICIN domain-containing protein n=1 Tax=Amycolatopsis sp. NPDC048633 TaxID=3157095 RepID=UPI0033D03F0D